MKAIDKNKTREIRHLSRKAVLRGARQVLIIAARVEAAPAAPAPAPVLRGPRVLPQGASADTRPAAACRQPEAPALELAPSSQPRSSPQLHRIVLLTPIFDSRGLSQVLAGASPTPSPSLDRAVPIQPLLTSLRTPPQAQHAPATPESRAQSASGQSGLSPCLTPHSSGAAGHRGQGSWVHPGPAAVQPCDLCGSPNPSWTQRPHLGSGMKSTRLTAW